MKKNYKLKAICMLCIITAAFSSCKKNELAEEKNLKNNHGNIAYSGDKKYDVLGHGYDVTDRFAEKESTRFQVIDIEKFVAQDPGSYLPKLGVVDYYDYTFGENGSSYSKRLSQKYSASLDVFGLFKGELNLSFAGKDSSSSKYIYASARKIIEQKSMQIFSTVNNIRENYLTDKFKSDLSSLSAQQLIAKYGTHVLTDITLGARFDFNYQSQTNSSKREEASKAGLKYNGLLSIANVTADIEVNKVEANSNFNQTVHYRSIGGDGTKGLIGDITLDNSPQKLTIAAWQSSCTIDNAVLIKIGKNGLIPIEDLIGDPVKKAEVKNYIAQYYIEHEYKLTPDPVNVFYSAKDNNHVYTINKNDYPYTQNGFSDFGTGFRAFTSQVPGSLPVHVFYNAGARNHTYTINRYDYPYEQNGYTYLGVNFYAYPSQVAGSSPVHVYYTNAGGGDHVYTINKNDYPYLQNGFSYLGVNFYAIK